jgi:hypothetical protein
MTNLDNCETRFAIMIMINLFDVQCIFKAFTLLAFHFLELAIIIILFFIPLSELWKKCRSKAQHQKKATHVGDRCEDRA